MVFERRFGPLGQQRDDHLAALITSAISNAFSTKAVSANDCMPKWEGVPNGDGT